MPERLLYFCTLSLGGIADYAHEQAKALSDQGLDVTLLCPTDFLHVSSEYHQCRELYSNSSGKTSRSGSRVSLARRILHNAASLDRLISKGGFEAVLFATYSEYLAPLWAWRFRRHAIRNVVFGAVVHDPVRDYQVGPKWWHRWSIAEGFSFLREAFVHDEIALDTVRPMPRLRTTVIPHGPLSLPAPSTTRHQFRKDIGIPDDARLFLSFGHIRDGKNLNLVIEAMREVPDAWLLVAGNEATPGQRQSAEYVTMAKSAGVADRCRWIVRYLSPVEASDCFQACDFVLMTYSDKFRSASGVLNIAVKYQKPLLVTSGEGNLATSVVEYHLGKYLRDSDPSTLAAGMRELDSQEPGRRWLAYENENSWAINAQIILQNLVQ